MEQVYEVWIEIQANKERILDKNEFRAAMEKCKNAGMTGIILSVKDTTGFVLYESSLAEHYSVFDADFAADVDYVKQCFAIIRDLGMKCYAAFDVFAEGNKKRRHPQMKGFKPGWECEVYGLDEDGQPVIRKSTDERNIQTVGSIDDFGEIFVNPGNEEVRSYELALLKEFAEKYRPDGIVLDRVRYVGLSTDFGESTKKAWEAYSGVTGENWPEDIYTIEQDENGRREIPGKYFGSFFEYRAAVVKSFIKSVREMIDATCPDVEFYDYTGSWYPLYYQVGANWASEQYESTEFPWCDGRCMAQTGYAEYVDRLLSGFYYSDIWMSEVEEKKLPAYWYSVEGSYEIASKVTKRKEGLVGSLFIEQYKEDPGRLQEAMSVCFAKTSGCMIFDLSYIADYDWWEYMKKVKVTQLEPTDCKELNEICKDTFREEYHMTEERIQKNLFGDLEFSWQESLKIVDSETGKILGFIGIKISKNAELYPDTAWISLFAVRKEEQKKGYGRMLLATVCENLKKQGIKMIYVGQDFNNFFPGIPDPDEEKESLFTKCGFTLNTEQHFDLEADITENALIENFDKTPFEKEFSVDTYRDDQTELLAFLEQEFPGRWVFEAKEAIANGKDPQSIVILWNQDKTEIVGYCMLSVDEKGYGGLGPIGIAKKIRGKHVGDFILNQSLQQLKQIGAVRVNIDWTILKDFYGQFGFKAERLYLAAYKRFE